MGLALVVPTSDYVAGRAEDDCSDRYVAGRRSPHRFVDGMPHRIDVPLVDMHRRTSR
jgi:hypothetical protein